jgi:hypothetical protein
MVTGRHLHATDSVRVIEVIEVRMRVGNGSGDDPVREVVQYWAKDGTKLAEVDGLGMPCEPQVTVPSEAWENWRRGQPIFVPAGPTWQYVPWHPPQGPTCGSVTMGPVPGEWTATQSEGR